MEALQSLRLTDLIDILLVTALVYAAIVWMRRTGAALIAVGMLILGLIYLTARALELQLTAWIFQGFFAIVVIIIVIIFQEELRQLFERLALWSLRRSTAAAPTIDPADILVEGLADFARGRIGALIILPGRQPIHRHLHGGQPLDGQLSLPLLKSIFDPHSPGHDGAVLVENGRIAQFGAHLPLSKNSEKLVGVGTRHSAALGLAERTDALCLVVSEERGTLAVAQDSKLHHLQGAQELAQLLQRFLEAQRPVPRRSSLWNALVRRNWGEKAAAFALVLGLWYVFVAGDRPTERSFEIPVQVLNLPEGYQLIAVQPKQVRVTLLGPTNAFYLFDPHQLQLSIDAYLVELGRRTFQLSDHSVTIPAGLTLQSLSPSQVKLSVRKLPAPQRRSQAESGPGN